MHPYYVEKQEALKKEMNGFLSLISSELEQRLPLSYEELFEKVWICYKEDMLEHFPYIGGDKSSGTHNLTGAYMFVALGVVCKTYGMSFDEWGYLTTLAYRKNFEKIPKFLLKTMGKLMKKSSLMTWLLKKKDKQNAANAKENPGSFETKTQAPTKQYPVQYYTLHCPLAAFAKEYGYMEYMPYICNLDYVMFECMEVPFYREKTCADGDDYCDFKMKKNASVVPAWPCHASNPNDPLK